MDSTPPPPPDQTVYVAKRRSRPAIFLSILVVLVVGFMVHEGEILLQGAILLLLFTTPTWAPRA